MRLPYYGYGNELIGAVYEFKKGKYVLGAQFGTELQEEFAEVGMFSFEGSYPGERGTRTFSCKTLKINN